MSIIKICNYSLSTNYKKTEVREKFEEILTSFLENSDPSIGFNLDHFIETITEDSDDFEILSEIDNDDPDIEYNEEQVDDFVELALSDSEDGDYIEVHDIQEEEEE